ncbi:hypothetical protein [Nocardia sp. IFM 10818]
MKSLTVKALATAALTAALATAAPAAAAPLLLQAPTEQPAGVSGTGSALTDYTGSAIDTDFAGSVENGSHALPALPCLLASFSGIRICDMTSPR